MDDDSHDSQPSWMGETDSWPDPLDGDGRNGTPMPPPAPSLTPGTTPSPTPGSSRLSRPWLIVVILGTVLVALAVRLGAVAKEMPQASTSEIVRAWVSTGLVFVVVPGLLAWVMTRLPAGAGTMSRVMAGTTIALLLVSTLLGEGAICVLIASPLIYGVAAGIVAIGRMVGSSRAILALLILVPIADLGAANPVEEVVVRRVVALDAHDVQARVEAGPSLPTSDLPWLLTLGYPVPDDPTVTREGDRTEWSWDWGAGRVRTAMHAREDGWDFEVHEDTAMRRWLAWETSQLDLRPHPEGTEVRLTLRFDPALGPDWYFGTIERAFVDAAGEHLLNGLDLEAASATTTPGAGVIGEVRR